MFDEDRRLYYHGYDSKKTMFWANDKGLSSSFWLRAEGWFTVALADVIGYMPSGERKERLCEIFREALDGLLYYLAPEKMFYQVIDQASRAGNYLETSGSAMVSYALMKGARIGVLEKRLGETGREIFDGICKTRLTEKDGSLNLGGICLVAGLGPEDNTRRNGSYEYYISEPVVENDAKGVGPFAMAYSEIKKLK
jgi:unsaturated rhamnogalacturonyl hydrolase